MKQRNIRMLVDTLQLALMTLITAGLVMQLGMHSANLLPALAVLAFMTPMVASCAVQLHRDFKGRESAELHS